MELGLYSAEGVLSPKRYSSGKTQLNLIKEVLEAFESSDIVFLKGMVGSGKSVVGIRAAIEAGGGVVSVPTKVLSDQYAESYGKEKFFLKPDGSRVKIGILKGRQNFPCLYAQKWELTAASRRIPCKRPLNRRVGEHRIDALKECAHWGFIFPANLAKQIKDARKVSYDGIVGKWTLCMKGECPYWKQFEAYADADVLVMNSAKWASEVVIGRLPKKPMTVVDEADEWLDSLALKLAIGEKRVETLKRKLDRKEIRQALEKRWKEVLGGEVEPLDFAYELALLVEELDETSTDFFWKLRWVLEHREHVEVEVRERSVVYLVPDPKPVLQQVLNRVSGKWLFMSATVQSKEVLREVFGIDPVFVEGEIRFPGKVIQRRVGVECPVVHSEWIKDGFREKYWEFLQRILDKAKRPCFLPVHAFKYLPPELAERLRSSEKDFLEVDGVLITTKMDRGADLKGMGSVVVLKFPFPEREDPLLKGMERRLGKEAFWKYYKDIAQRCFVQQLGRVMRSESDVVEFWSPDEICHRMLRKLWKGRIEVKRCSL